MRDRIAVYGTLKRAFGVQQRLGVANRLSYVGPCRLRGDLYDLGRYPGLAEGGGEVEAELFEVLDASVVPELDRFEGPGYERRKVELLEPQGRAWVYVLLRRPPESRRIAAGRWTGPGLREP